MDADVLSGAVMMREETEAAMIAESVCASADEGSEGAEEGEGGGTLAA